jgi:membrane fusion protein, copper/silver efflux system
MKQSLRFLAISLALVSTVVLVSCSRNASTDAVTEAGKPAKYHCAMHPSVVSDKPGNCPICNMKLVPIDAPGQTNSVAVKKTLYRSSMNPNEVSDKPGKDSMGMEMIPVEVTAGTGTEPPGLTTVSITPEARERMGLTFGTVERRTLSRDLRTSARIVPDEVHLYHVTVKTEGWVEHLHEVTKGAFFKKGVPLMKIYSPELVTAGQDYLVAWRNHERILALGSSANPDAARDAEAMVASARKRLEFLDFPAARIERIERTGEVEKEMTIYSPVDGWVAEINIAAGHKIMQGESLLVLADYSAVWANADVYEPDLPFVKIGMPVELTVPYYPNKVFRGDVSFISPTLDPETRTVKVRMNIPNPNLLLKPEMYADARLSYELGERLAVPAGAVMFSGDRVYAFRDGGDGRLVPVLLKLGLRSDGYFEVLSGLKEGDRVVTSANFLVDSESSMKAAIEALAGK